VAFVTAVKEFVDVLNIEPLKRGMEESIKVVSEDVAKRLGALSRDLADALKESVGGVGRGVSDVGASVAMLHGEVRDLKDAVQGLLTIVTIVLIVSVIAVALSAVAIIRQRRPS